jgi:hypothetical protein
VALSAYLSATNQKLLFARQLLALADKAKTSSQSGFRDSHQTEAVVQSVAVQLSQAWHWHLQDVASNYKLAEPGLAVSADKLVELLAADGKCPAEATEMQSLAADTESWAAELLRAQQQVYQLPVIRKAEMDADRLPMIAVDASAADGARLVDWNIERAAYWMNQLQELVTRQRDMMVEF